MILWKTDRAHYYARREHVILDDHETQWDTMKVTKKLAAQMVGLGRTTFYRHIDEKKISVHDARSTFQS